VHVPCALNCRLPVHCRANCSLRHGARWPVGETVKHAQLVRPRLQHASGMAPDRARLTGCSRKCLAWSSICDSLWGCTARHASTPLRRIVVCCRWHCQRRLWGCHCSVPERPLFIEADDSFMYEPRNQPPGSRGRLQRDVPRRLPARESTRVNKLAAGSCICNEVKTVVTGKRVLVVCVSGSTTRGSNQLVDKSHGTLLAHRLQRETDPGQVLDL